MIFLKIVKIVVNNEPNIEYIKKTTFMEDGLISDEVIADIFETIRAKQVAIKTKTKISGAKLRKQEDALKLNHTLDVKSINSLILGKIIGHDIVSKNQDALYMPTRFCEYLRMHSIISNDEIDDVVNDATNGIYQMLINENLNKDFWLLIYSIMEECSTKEVSAYNILNNIKKKHKNILYVSKASEAELIYLIACIIGGIKNEN